VPRWHLLKIHAGVFSKNELGIEAVEVAEEAVEEEAVATVATATIINLARVL
jgi:hypothetical protein